MKLKVLKKSATIQLESKEEVQAFAQALVYYMEMIYQDANPEDKEEDSHYDCDDLMRTLNKKFNKESK